MKRRIARLTPRGKVDSFTECLIIPLKLGLCAGLENLAVILPLLLMITDHVRSVFERVAHRMVRVGWLEEYRFNAQSGHELVWRVDGAQKALLFRDLVERFGLANGGGRPLQFHLACKGVATSENDCFRPIEIEVRTFWLLCIAELGLSSDADGLLGVIHIVTSWSPEEESVIAG